LGDKVKNYVIDRACRKLEIDERSLKSFLWRKKRDPWEDIGVDGILVTEFIFKEYGNIDRSDLA
jgi:hypothetical protein